MQPCSSEQLAHAVGVVVGEDRLDTQRLEVLLVEREVEQHVERLGAALVGDVSSLPADELGMRGRLR